jgi:hypothetical protein
MLANNQPYSARNASSGEIKLAREAGMRDARIADNPCARTAPTVTTDCMDLFRKADCRGIFLLRT